MRALVAGGAGFLGAHLCRRLAAEGWNVVALDNLSTSTAPEYPTTAFVRGDITRHVDLHGLGKFDWVFNLASPASPPAYLKHPIGTLYTGSLGTLNLLALAERRGASFFQASTSEVYGDPTEHPQRESYWGTVNPIGPRSVYDEGKRFGEAAVSAYARKGLDVRIARIFNTYGPGMKADDGRAIPQFVTQALAELPITIYGDGLQTRSLCYVDDLIEGIIRMTESDYTRPINLGNPHEITLGGLASVVRFLTKSHSEYVFEPLPQDDPIRRCPDISLARRELGWEPQIGLDEGLRKTIDWFRENA